MSSGALFVEPIVIADDGALTSSNVDGSLDPPAWSAAATYTLGQQATSGTSIYQSVQDADNINHPVTDTAWWVRVGATNRLRMFDQKIGAQTERADTIEVVITPMSVIGVVSLRNVEALSVRVRQSTVPDGVLYDRTVSLDDPVGDWFEYWFSAVTHQSEAIFTDLLPLGDASYTITIDNTGSVAKCGELLMGAALDAGITEVGVQTGIEDYSLIAPDEFGVRDIVERDFAEVMDLTVYVQEAKSATLVRLLTRNRARPILLVASSRRPDAQNYGLAESWRRTLSFPDMDVFTVSMKGLT
jgi:hypothetical protein